VERGYCTCASDFGVWRFKEAMKHDIVCSDFPIGKSLTGEESVDVLTHRVLGFWVAREPCSQVS
jgi:hypothetical protein